AAWIKKLLFVFLLGGLQGFVGWIMVASGLEGDPWVDPSKLTIHLLLALVLLMVLVFYALSFRTEDIISDHPVANRSVKWVIAIILIQITLGGLMAGTDAGRLYNTWPLMNSKFIPDGAFQQMMHAEKLTQLTTEINFLHRNFAIIVALSIIGFWWQNRKFASPRVQQLNAYLLLLLFVQFLLGIFTLLGSKINIPVALGVAHQTIACILLGVSVAILFYTKNRHGVKLKG
ncbi:MAG: COX15/CtaA family protein, partial [Chitinophagales bacterium]